MSEPTALAKRLDTVRSWLETQRPELEKVLTPQGMDAGRFARIAYTAVLRQHKLAECDKASFILAIMESAALGLEIDSVSGLSYLVPFRGRVQLIVGYRGMVQLALRHPKVTGADAVAVFEGDHFVYQEGDHPKLEHRRMRGQIESWETMLGAYARHQIGGARRWHATFMYREEIEAHRALSASWQRDPASSVWTSFPIGMAKKTAFRDHARWMPQSPQLMRAMAIESDPEDERPLGNPPVPHGTTVDDVLNAIAGGDVKPSGAEDGDARDDD